MSSFISEILSADMVAPLVLILLIVIAAFGRSLRVDVKTMTAELKPNGGKSTKDQIEKIAEKLDQHMHNSQKRHTSLHKRITELEKKHGEAS